MAGSKSTQQSWRDKEPESTVRRAEISGNVVKASSRVGREAPRFGIEVGHFANQLLIDGNEITSPDPGTPDFRKDAGIFVLGWRGPMLVVSGNYVRGFRWGGFFAPQLSPSPSIWKVAGNAMTVSAPANFRLADNL